MSRSEQFVRLNAHLRYGVVIVLLLLLLSLQNVVGKEQVELEYVPYVNDEGHQDANKVFGEYDIDKKQLQIDLGPAWKLQQQMRVSFIH